MQKGNLFQRSEAWYIRYYAEDGKRKTQHLGYVADYPNQSDIEPKAREFMVKVSRSVSPSITLQDFIRLRYLPYVEKELRPSVVRGYKSIFNAHLRDREASSFKVIEYTTAMVQDIIDKVSDGTRTKSTIARIKFLLSGVFVYACHCGIREGNPVTDCRLPRRAKEGKKTYAYTLDEIKAMILLLPYPQKAAVAIAGYAGLRLAELCGLEWGDYDELDLNIKRTVWQGHVSETKSLASRDYVPVVDCLKVILDGYRTTLAFPTSSTRLFSPTWIDNDKLMLKLLNGTGIPWRGWHSFRRGLATNLAELGASDKVIQRILRHATVTVTREHYIKVRDSAVDEAMAELGRKIGPSSVLHWASDRA